MKYSIIGLLLLSGCASTLSPTRPTPADIGADNSAVNAVSAVAHSPLDYESSGLKLARQNCLGWFTVQVQGAQGASFLTQILSVGAGAATLAGGPMAAAGMALGASGIGAYQNSFGTGASPVSAYILVSRVLDTMETAVLSMPPPSSYEDADNRVSTFAAQCSLPAIQASIMQAATSVPLSTSFSPPASVETFEPRILTAPRRSTKNKETSSLIPACAMTVMGCAAPSYAVPHVIIGH